MLQSSLEAYLGPCLTSVKKMFRLLTINYFRKKAHSQMFDGVLNTFLKSFWKRFAFYDLKRICALQKVSYDMKLWFGLYDP